MGDSSGANQKLGDSGLVALTGKIMVVAIIVLFLVVVFVVFLHLYSKWFLYRREQDGDTTDPTRRRRRRQLDFAAGDQELAIVTALRHGLDSSVLKSIPVVIFTPKDFKDGLECAVCLSEVSEGENARLLPKCNHGFHVDCIDMWFQSHSTCPLCRNPVSSQSSSLSTSSESSPSPVEVEEDPSSVTGYSTESPNFPTNVLFWGNQTRVNTLGSCLEEDNQAHTSSLPASSSSSSTSSNPDGMLVIDIPRQINEDEDSKSPMTTRLRSLKRLLSRGRRISPSTPGNVDVEQVARGQS